MPALLAALAAALAWGALLEPLRLAAAALEQRLVWNATEHGFRLEAVHQPGQVRHAARARRVEVFSPVRSIPAETEHALVAVGVAERAGEHGHQLVPLQPLHRVPVRAVLGIDREHAQLGVEVHRHEVQALPPRHLGRQPVVGRVQPAGLLRAHDARVAARRKLVFTTHTPVVAGNEAHDVELLLEAVLGIPRLVLKTCLDRDLTPDQEAGPFETVPVFAIASDLGGAVPGLQLGYEHSFIHAMVEFIKGLESGKGCTPNFTDGLATDYVVDAVLKSAKTGKWEKVKSAK